MYACVNFCCIVTNHCFKMWKSINHLIGWYVLNVLVVITLIGQGRQILCDRDRKQIFRGSPIYAHCNLKRIHKYPHNNGCTTTGSEGQLPAEETARYLRYG